MANQYYDRYEEFVKDGSFKIVPGIELPIKPTDRYIQYKKGKHRLDILSQEFYGSPLFGWLILQANPIFGGMENNIYDGAVLVVPFPLVPSLQDYKQAIETYFYYYGR